MGADNGPLPDGGAAIRVIDPSVVGARAGTPGQGVDQAAIAGLLTGAQDPVQLAQNASANNGSVPVAVGLGGDVPVTVVLGGPVGPDAAGDFHSHGHHLFDPKLRPGGKSEPKTTSTHES